MTKKKKALIIGEAFYPEDFLINDLVQEWEKDKYEFAVLTRAPSYPFGKVYEGYKNRIYQTTYYNTIKVYRFPVVQGYEKSTLIKILNYFSFVFWSFWIVLFIGRRFDRVFIYQTGPLTLATAGIILKKLYKAQVTIWTQDLWPETVYAYGFKKTRFLSFCLEHFVKWIYKNCDNILVSCEGFIDRLRRYVPEKDITFIPNWSLMKYSPVQKQRLPGKFNFTFAGNIGKVQNLDNIVLGFSKFAKGRKPLAEMPNYYEASDVLVMSLKDTPLYEIMIPSKFQAYLTTHKPIYAIFKGEVKQLVEDYGLGIIAHPSDIDEIALGFENFLSLSDEQMQRISENALRLLDSVFNREMIIEKINLIFWRS